MHLERRPGPRRAARVLLPWPLPALLGWLLAWAVFVALRGAWPPLPAFLAAAACGALPALAAPGLWRAALATAGFPLSVLALGGLPGVPGWLWALAAAPLALAYPVRVWRDAPFFPTPAPALAGLDAVIGPLGPQDRVLDAGCGLGHALLALHALFPAARLEGVEWSRPLARLAARRCRDRAQVRRGDLWAERWSGLRVVYLFQRPESMPRAAAKAAAEMDPGSWLVSLEFEAPPSPALQPVAKVGKRPLWVYRVVAAGAPAVGRSTAPPRSR